MGKHKDFKKNKRKAGKVASQNAEMIKMNDFVLLVEQIMSADEPNMDPNFISLRDVLCFINMIKLSFPRYINRILEQCNRFLESHHLKINKFRFDFDKQMLILDVVSWAIADDGHIIIEEQRDLEVYKSEEFRDVNILSDISYDTLFKFRYVFYYIYRVYDQVWFLDSLKANDECSRFMFGDNDLLVNIDFNGITLRGNIIKNSMAVPYEIFYSSETEACEIKGLPDNAKNLIAGQDKDLLENMFVELDNCPKWIRGLLRSYRNTQIDKYYEEHPYKNYIV